MNAATERKLIRWFHIMASIPTIGYVYGPVATIPEATNAVRFILMPGIVASGFWLWKGHVVKKWFRSINF